MSKSYGNFVDISSFEPERPRINVGDQDLRRQRKKAIATLDASNREEPRLFMQNGQPVRFEVGPDDQPRIRAVTKDRMRHELARRADWYRVSAGGQEVAARVPVDLAAEVLATPHLPLPPLLRVVPHPFFAPGGKLVCERGYHAESGTFCWPPEELLELNLSKSPCDFEVGLATEYLDQVLVEFPFAGVAERAHAFCVMFLLFVRLMIKGGTPLHLIEKPAPGTGATYLVERICQVAGVESGCLQQPRGDAESVRRIFSVLRCGAPVVFMDNLRGVLDSSVLARALTAEHFGDRVVGTSDQGSAPVFCVWIGTGNNPLLTPELLSRTVRIRLDAKMERPERRRFKKPDLRDWVEGHRPDLMWACLTIVQAWVMRGQPPGRRVHGRYPEWSRVMGGILAVSKIPGFLENLDDHRDSADAHQTFRAFVTEWYDERISTPVAARDLLAIADEVGLDLESEYKNVRLIKLGLLLRANVGRIWGGLKIETAGIKDGAQTWRLVAAEAESSQTDSGGE